MIYNRQLYTVYIKRTERTKIAGYDTSHDYVKFEDMQSAYDYAMGKSAYDHLDYSQKLMSYEYPICIKDCSDKIITRFAFVKTNKGVHYERNRTTKTCRKIKK